MSGFVTVEDLLEIGEYVETAHGRLNIRGLGIGEVLQLVSRYPVLNVTDDKMTINTATLLAVAPDAAPEIIAIAADFGLNNKAISAARRFGAEDQAAIIDRVMERTMPNGPGPFVEALSRMMARLKR